MDEVAVTAALAFLNALWPERPNTTALQLWEKRTKKTYTFADANAAATYAVGASHGTDVYIAAGLGRAVVKPSLTRASSDSVAGIPGLWADIDINGGPDVQTNKAPDRDAALELAFSLLEPTVIVNSGYGLQAWWLFDTPWIFRTVDEREQAARLSAGFLAAMRAQARQRHDDWKMDGVFDLARLMRLPGTRNHKDPTGDVAVEQLPHDGPRYDDLEAFWTIARDHLATAGTLLQTLTGATVDIELGADPKAPLDRIIEIFDVDQDFDIVWNHRAATKTKNWSMSEFDMSIANTLVAAGFDDQEIADSLRYHRRRFGDDGGKGDRADYIKRTIGKARGGERHEASRREVEYERSDTIDQLVEISAAPSGEIPSSTVTSLFAKVVGGPPIKELVQEGRDPDNSRFKLVLADGREVPLGAIDGLMSQPKFRQKFAVVTGHLPRKISDAKGKGPKWDDVVQALLNAATVNDGPDDTRAARAAIWVQSYSDRRTSTDQDAACEAHDPFEKDDWLYVPLDPLRQWVQKTQGDRIDRIDLKLMLEAAGFERKTVMYRRSDKSKSSRSYFRLPKDALVGAPAVDQPDEPDPPQEATPV